MAKNRVFIIMVKECALAKAKVTIVSYGDSYGNNK